MERKEILTNGVSISYIKSGEGRPIILVHGNAESNAVFSNIIEKLSQEGFSVYAPDSRGHGKSGKVKRLNYDDMANDIMALIKHEGLEILNQDETAKESQRPIFFGFSDGGIIGLLLAVKYPKALSRLIVAGINLNPDGLIKITRRTMRALFFISRSDKLRLMLTQPSITKEQLQTIEIPTYVFHAENDIVKLSDSTAAAENVKNGKLIVVEKHAHGSYVKDNEKLYELIKDIINEKASV